MTKKKIDAVRQLSPYVERKHYACRIRLDLWNELKATCTRLNCSQGVYLEVALSKVLLSDLVTEVDVFSYSPMIRWYEKARNRLELGQDFFGKQITDEEREKLIKICSVVIRGEVDISHPYFDIMNSRGYYHGGRMERLYQHLFEERSGFLSHKAKGG